MSETALPDAPQDSAALIEHIVARYHAAHRENLPRLVALADKVEAVHAGDPDVPEGLADALDALGHALAAHISEELAVLFPAMRGGAPEGLAAPIAARRAAHEDHAAAAARIRRLTRDLTPPGYACGSWRALYAGTADLLDDLAAHAALENDVLFPRFENA